jgi:hypothetical protein
MGDFLKWTSCAFTSAYPDYWDSLHIATDLADMGLNVLEFNRRGTCLERHFVHTERQRPSAENSIGETHSMGRLSRK